MKKVLIGSALIIGLLVLTARTWVPYVFAEIGKNGFSADKAIVQKVFKTNEIIDMDKQHVAAQDGETFLNIDLHIEMPINQIDFYDFQLVKDDRQSLGYEENIGDYTHENYFNALALNDEGKIINDWDDNANEINMRLIFQIPKSEKEGYLVFWGEYIGPIQFN